MAVTILDLTDTTFSINGITYDKHFQGLVNGDNLKVSNVYDSKVVIQDFADYAAYTVDSVSYASIELLQAALVSVLFTRSGGSGTSTSAATKILSGVNPTLDCSIYTNASLTFLGNTILSLNNLSNGQSGNIKLTQDATGNRTLIIVPSPKVINGGAGAITLTGTALSTDIISWWYDGADLNVTIGLNYTKA